MSSISSLGIGSGLDLGNLVDRLVAVERQAREGPLFRRRARTELRLSALGSLKATVEGFVGTLSSLSEMQVGRSVSSSNSDAVTGTAVDTADTASYLINVTQIALAQSLATDAKNPFTDADASLGAGTLTVSIGSDTLDIDLASGSDSLNYVRDQINASDMDIHAAVVQDGANYRLLLTSGKTGLAGEMTLTVSGTVDSRLRSTSMDETTAAADAEFSVNGLDLTSSSNSIEGVLPGVTLELHTATAGGAVTLEVTSAVDATVSRLNDIVSSYNALVTSMSALGSASKDGTQAGPLVGDASLRALQRQLGSIFSTNLETDLDDNPFANLVSIGVHTDLSGRASLDATELKNALAENEAGVEALIRAFGAFVEARIDPFEGEDSILSHRTDQLNAELKEISQQREDLNRRMLAVEERLRTRFAALDSLVSQFNQTSSYLQQQLSSIRAIAEYSSRS